ncbi:major capsid protein [Dipodfec virus UOA04_Rod_781]|nr:major capsid protein [Dipodfec virus UOA04_Rod_781]
MSKRSGNYKTIGNAGSIHFSRAMFSSAEKSRMVANPVCITTCNAGDIVPVYCREVLPEEELSISFESVIRQTTLLTPTMGELEADMYAFFVPNRVVNDSWKAVFGENYSGSWTARPVSLATLVSPADTRPSIQIPVGSVADYYGFPTQDSLPTSLLQRMHDLKFRGYVCIYNEYFRDQNYQPPIPFSPVNMYQGYFLSSTFGDVNFQPLTGAATLGSSTISAIPAPSGSVGAGAVTHALHGSASRGSNGSVASVLVRGRFSALDRPLKANKFHDYFTSVLPSPQKSNQNVEAPISGLIPSLRVSTTNSAGALVGPYPSVLWADSDGNKLGSQSFPLFRDRTSPGNEGLFSEMVPSEDETYDYAPDGKGIHPVNLATTPGSVDTLSISVNDIRLAAAMQQVYEVLARGGSRYRSLLGSFYGVEVDDPFSDIPSLLGKVHFKLDMFQTAQTSPSVANSTPQGNLAGFGYTSVGMPLFKYHAIEHGYVHIFLVIRHRNLYSSYLAKDNFRLNMFDFYLPPLANISEQPVMTYEINPFTGAALDNIFGYNEAWSEYRYEPDTVSGYMRSGIDGSLNVWNYADSFDSSLSIADGTWLQSNTADVVDRTVAVSSSKQPQFKVQIRFNVDKTLPMPTYSVPGMDII